MVKLFVENGAGVNVRVFDQRTPLHLAVSENRVTVVSYLLRHPDIDVMAVDRWGHTALDEAREVLKTNGTGTDLVNLLSNQMKNCQVSQSG
ncbi:hypothetical protein K7432_015922 [Basidiobolus ranarum]|uniref:Uncharacterized protein n=1 Tax=Basidiobolus ranarum TaxID=34480 RepID=A0ABR2WFM8_9FUNG